MNGVQEVRGLPKGTSLQRRDPLVPTKSTQQHRMGENSWQKVTESYKKLQLKNIRSWIEYFFYMEATDS